MRELFPAALGCCPSGQHSFISHDLTTVRHINHRIAIIYLSQLIEIGTSDQIFASPQHPYSRALLSSMLYPDPTLKRPNTYTLRGEIPSPIHLPKSCYLFSRCRCPKAELRCQESYPPMVDLKGDHRVSCFRATRLDELSEYTPFVAPANVSCQVLGEAVASPNTS